jgi:hypothetical protein
MKNIFISIMDDWIDWELQPLYKKPSITWWTFNLLTLCTIYFFTSFAVIYTIATLQHKYIDKEMKNGWKKTK